MVIYPEKLRLLGQIADQVDVVFLGSSLYLQHIDPRVVDREWQGEGDHSVSFNLGVPALTILEQFRLLDHLSHLRPPRLRYVVLDPVLNANVEFSNLATERVLATHHLADTWMQMRYVVSTAARPRRKIRFLGLHMLGFTYQAFYVPELNALRPGDRGYRSYLDPAQRGFHAAGDMPATKEDDPLRALLASEPFRQLLSAADPYSPNGPLLPEYQQEVVTRLLERVRGLGAEPLFVLTPRLEWDVSQGRPVLNYGVLHAFRRTAARFFPAIPLLCYYEPTRNPQYYRSGVWWDSHHLGSAGAALFSETLARDLAACRRRGAG